MPLEPEDGQQMQSRSFQWKTSGQELDKCCSMMDGDTDMVEIITWSLAGILIPGHKGSGGNWITEWEDLQGMDELKGGVITIIAVLRIRRIGTIWEGIWVKIHGIDSIFAMKMEIP
ncbi:hypothetical protein SUGI_0042360 [Cryptomeria japonica]|nr:hypothetical protein SUGI_0042360 [Cryptomeria japonica]